MLKSHHSQTPSFHEVDKGVLILKSGAPHQSKAPSSQFRVIRVLILKSGALPDLRVWGLARSVSFSEFERRIILQQIRPPNFGVRHLSASGWGQTEFKLQRIRAPNFGVKHIFGFSLGADRL